jgi:hypothetical protein
LRLVAVKILTVLAMRNVALSPAVVSQEKNVNLFVIQETALLELIVQLATTEKPVLVGFLLKEMVMQLV